MVELDTFEFDLLLLSETWRGDREEHFTTTGGHKVFLSGGSPGRRGVGICISKKLLNKIDSVLFFCYSDRVCVLHFTLGTIQFQVFSCYMPTTWEPDLAVEQFFELVGLLLTCCADSGNVSILGGDFNAVLGSPMAGDESSRACTPKNGGPHWAQAWKRNETWTNCKIDTRNLVYIQSRQKLMKSSEWDSHQCWSSAASIQCPKFL